MKKILLAVLLAAASSLPAAEKIKIAVSEDYIKYTVPGKKLYSDLRFYAARTNSSVLLSVVQERDCNDLCTDVYRPDTASEKEWSAWQKRFAEIRIDVTIDENIHVYAHLEPPYTSSRGMIYTVVGESLGDTFVYVLKDSIGTLHTKSPNAFLLPPPKSLPFKLGEVNGKLVAIATNDVEHTLLISSSRPIAKDH